VRTTIACLALVAWAAALPSLAQSPAAAAKPAYDEALAKSVGADERGMRAFVLVVLKTGPSKVPAGAARDEMFKGHFANIKRLAAEGKLAVAGPLDGVDGWRGLYIFAVPEIEEARKLVASDPVVMKGEMVPEFHKFYGAATLMLVNEAYPKVAKNPM